MAKEKLKKDSSYGAESITVLEGLEPVRKRPGMYIGSTSASGLHHLIWEVVDNGIDEAMAGHATEIDVTLFKDGLVRVYDNGRGIPVEAMKATGLSALETVMTKLHAGGKFGGGGYKVSGGLHGVGVSVVNALSEKLIAEIHRDGKIWTQEYKRGIPQGKVKAVGKADDTATIITFKADNTIFETIEYDWGKILDRLRQQAYLTKKIKMIVKDERDGHRPKNFEFYFEGGIKTYVKSLHRNNDVKNETIFYVDKEVGDCRIEVALQYNDAYNETVLTFANNIINPEGGTHLAGLRSALTRTLNNYARAKNLLKEKEENLTGDDVREGLTAIVSVKLPNPQFEGQTKSKLGNAEIKTYVEQVFGDAFTNFLEENPKQAQAIIGKCVLSAQARAAARSARTAILRKGALEGMTLPGKLADCSSRHPEDCELYLVEGDSAGGCFSGDTKVALTDGRELSFKELIEEYKQGKKNYCYTLTDDNDVTISPIINPRLTRTRAEVIKIILDNNEEIVCTPDHKFRLVDGSYFEARQLTPQMSLAPLYRKLSQLGGRINIDGYEMVWNGQNKKWIFTHLLADQYNLRQGVYDDGQPHRHHQGFNKLNNNPDNLIRLNKEQQKYWADRDNKAKQAQKVKEFFLSHPEQKTILSIKAKEQWNDRELKEWRARKTKEQWTDSFRAKRLITYNQTYYHHSMSLLKKIFTETGTIDGYEQARAAKRNKNILKFSTLIKRFFKGEVQAVLPTVAKYNHKIKKIVKLREKINVYDLEVADTHNFALASGVFVHNSAKQGRDRKFQAILPLRGKILNVERARLDKMLANNEIKNLVIAMGMGIGEQVDLEKLRYHKVIIMTDADVDGAHIRTLLLTLFFRHFPDLINNGHLYIAQPPLYQLKKGADIRYAYSDKEKEDIIKDMGGIPVEIMAPSFAEATEGKEDATDETQEEVDNKKEVDDKTKVAKISIQRYKGLGEMNPEQLWNTTMNPDSRVMKQVNVEDAAKANEVFEMLMGDEVAPRKHFIQTHAKAVKNLDI